MDWLEASLNHLLYWEPDEIYLCEGCWDSKYPRQSTDGTFEYLMEWKNGPDNAWVIENRQDGSYRENQAATCNQVRRLANLEPGDWIMYHACDAFYYKHAIDVYKNLMENADFDYPIFDIWNFWDSVNKYYLHRTKQAMNLPHRIIKGAEFVPTCDLTVGGKHYHESNKAMGLQVPMVEFHYEGFRNPDRLKQKYGVGDRKSPTEWNNGIKLKNRKVWNGAHPSFAVPVLKEKFFYETL